VTVEVAVDLVVVAPVEALPLAIGFLEAPFSVVIDTDADWRKSIGSYPSKPQWGSLENQLSCLLPLTAPTSRYLWVATHAGWTAYFDNDRHGSDPWGVIPFLSRRIGCRGVALLWHPDSKMAYGGARFDLYGQPPTSELNYTRTIAAINDGGRWVWHAEGEAQPFEESDRYLAKRIQDRLSSGMIQRYAQALSIESFDISFYAQEGLLVENANLRSKPVTESLEEVRKRLGLEAGR